MTATRLASGGRIDRVKPLSFTFDGRACSGFKGDTLASALLAANEAVVARSFKLHRPRGIVGAGYEDPGAVVERVAPRRATNQLATVLPLEDGAVYRSVNAWPSARGDLAAVLQGFSRLLPPGFYYKTFFRPGWHLFEPLIRRAAGLGAVPPPASWEPVSESRWGHCDVLIVGGGPAGLTAALAAGRSGARTILVDDGALAGGRLVGDGGDRGGFVDTATAELGSLKNVRLLLQATAWGYHEHDLLTVLERSPADAPGLDYRSWRIRARQVILATGAIERPVPFANNDLPGVLLASAVRTYLGRFAVRAGANAVVFTNNDSAYATALALRQAGADVTLADARAQPSPGHVERLRKAGIEVLAGTLVAKAHGRPRVKGVDLRDPKGALRRIDADLVAVSGGWNPAIHLATQSRQASAVWHPGLATFVAEHGDTRFRLAGASRGIFAPAACAADGLSAAVSALAALGRKAADVTSPDLEEQFVANDVTPVWMVPPVDRRDRIFVDLTGDVTTDDLGIALREGYDSIELVKRYTTAGMGIDQGKTGNVNVIALLGRLTGSAPESVGTTTFRPPFVPVEFGALAGARQGARLYPWRHTPLTDWHLAAGAVMYEAGLRWQRPGYYPRSGEGWREAATREARGVRESVGVYDGSPLGKFQLKGPDVPALLDLLYPGSFAKLAPGRGKYGVMLTDDGLILDDGVTFRLDEARWLLHSSTGAADRVHQHIEQILAIHRPDWRVSVIPVTSAWVNVTVCGPRARDVLATMQPDFAISPTALPFMALAEGRIAGLPVRVFRVSWTGEQSFELNTPARHGVELWQAVMQAGRPFGIVPVGSEANHILRVESGYISTGHEVDGTADLYDLGLGGLIAKEKRDFIGKRAMEIRRKVEPERFELVGLLPDDPARQLPDGAPLTPGGARADQEGFVSAAVQSVALARTIALGLLRNGRSRHGETVHARVDDEIIPMQVVPPVFHDAERARVNS